jgi:AcrR family transcriptional regulator
VGYEAMSPRDIQARSAAKPGSLDHHFPSKLAIAEVALGRVAAEAWSVAGTSHRFAALRCFGGFEGIADVASPASSVFYEFTSLVSEARVHARERVDC